MNSIYIALNLFKRVFSDRKGWFSTLLLPVLVISGIIAAVGDDASRPITVGVANLDHGALGAHLVEQLAQHSEEYAPVAMGEQEIKDAIVAGKLPIGVVIPADFTDSLLAGKPSSVQNFYVSLTEDTFTIEVVINQFIRQADQTIRMAAGAIEGEGDKQLILTKTEQILQQQAKNQVGTVVTDTGLDANAQLFLVIGFTLFFVMGQILNALGLVLEDRNQMTMARIYTAPVRSIEIALGNFLGSFGLGAIQILAVLAITYYGLGYDYGIGFLQLFVILSFFLLASVGIGSAVAGLVKTSSNIGPLNALIITPTCMLGGCWWPLSVMPDFMQKIANFVPQKWTIEAVESMASGGSFTQIALHLGILALFAVIFLGFGAVVLRPSEEAV